MWGAIIGDLAGSIYEYEQIKGIKKVNCSEIIPQNAFFSDDTILTIAVLDAIQHDKDYEKYLRLYGNKYALYKPNFEPYFKTSFAPGFIKWLKNERVFKYLKSKIVLSVRILDFKYYIFHGLRYWYYLNTIKFYFFLKFT